MLLNCGVGEDSWESLGLQGDPTSPSLRRSVLGVHWRDWCWSWNSNPLATWCKELTHLKDPDAGKDWGQEGKGTTKDKMAEWHHQLLESTQTHVHWVSDVIQPSHPLSSPSPPTFNLSQHQGLSNESVLRIRWPKYWSFTFSISPSNDYSGLISFKMDWLDLHAVQYSIWLFL